MGGSLLSLLGKDKEGVGIVDQEETELTEPLGEAGRASVRYMHLIYSECSHYYYFFIKTHLH